MKKLIFDADMLLYISCLATEHVIDWGNNIWTRGSDFNETTCEFSERVHNLIEKVLDHYNYEGKYELLMCLTDTENFRKKLLPEYKENRKNKPLPICFNPMREWIADTFPTLQEPTLEADDCIGLSITDDCVIISGDKDMRCIPAPFFDFVRNEYFETTKEDAQWWHLFQTVTGDTADNYKGAVGFGAKKTERLFEEKGATWEAVLHAFKGDEEAALLSAQVAYILQGDMYDWKTKHITLWTPQAMLQV